MANTSIVTQEMLQDTLQNYHENLVYPFLNGATHTGCVPLGTILPYFGETAPTHFLICDGTTYNKADYPELAAHLLALTDPSPYVVSGDNTKFKVPDLRGEFLRGTGTNSHSGQGSGANVGVHQDGTTIPVNWVDADGTNYIYGDGVIRNFDSVTKANKYRAYSQSSFGTVSSTNANYTIRPTNTSVTYIIAYRNAYIDLALDSFPIDISNPTDGQLLMYDATAGRWVNGGHKYSTDEHVVGTWIDGRPLYEKSYVDTTHRVFQTNSQSIVLFETDTSKELRFCEFGLHAAENYGGRIIMPTTPINKLNGTAYFTAYSTQLNSGNIQLVFSWASGGQYTVDEIWATYRYTKTTD